MITMDFDTNITYYRRENNNINKDGNFVWKIFNETNLPTNVQ